MAKGAIAKAQIIKEILGHFPGSFTYNDGKEIRIPFNEEGENVQIKVTLTCAKENVNPGDDNARPGTAALNDNKIDFSVAAEKSQTVVEPTEDEKKNVSDLLRALGL